MNFKMAAATIDNRASADCTLKDAERKNGYKKTKSILSNAIKDNCFAALLQNDTKFNCDMLAQLANIDFSTNNNNMSDNKNCIQTINRDMECLSDVNSVKSDILDFYKGKKIFITGGTGFLGKILIEKLLRTCDIDTIYLLIRVKKGKDGHSRLDNLFADPIFDRLKFEVPKFRHKIVVIHGDCETQDLGISLVDRRTLVDNVNVIFHSAATVRFDERLRTALAINVKAALNMLQMAKEMQNLKAFIHVSTAYSNCHLSRIEEKFYDCPLTCSSLEHYIEKRSDQEIEDVLPQILGLWPNTYALTKALAEKEIRENCKGVTLGIFRPAIVTSTVKEPVAGWVDNLYGPTGVVAGAATGVLRTLHCDGEISAEIVPVDRVVNCIIASAYDVSRCKLAEPKIYNYVSSVESRIQWKDFLMYNIRFLHSHPLNSAIWYVTLALNKTSFMNRACIFMLHLLPAIFVDGAAVCFGQKPRLLKAYRKIHKFSAVLSYFCTHEIIFCNRNVRELWKTTSTKDRELFPFNMAEICWESYFATYMKGIRTYIFKESEDSLEQAKEKWRRLRMLHLALKAVFYFIVIYFLWTTLARF